MAIYRGTGGAGDASANVSINQVTEKALEAEASAEAAASSASSAASSASSASTSATNAANSATSASNSATASASSATTASDAATAAQTAQTAAETAETNAETAQAAAESARDATLDFGNDLTVSASTLAEGVSATATYDSNDPSIAFGIPVGATGATGPQGPQGIQGIQGEQGIQGIQGETGPQGIQGIQGETGDTGATGPQGDQGIQGIQGIQGETGPAGADGADGADGTDGVGVPAGGTEGQVLKKVDGTDYNTTWGEASTVAALNDLTDVNTTGVTDGQVIAYDATAGEWQPADQASAAGTFTTYKYTATSSQTVFTGADDDTNSLLINNTDSVIVTLNGITLENGTDYTATTSAVTLTSGATTDDEVNIYAFNTFDVASYTQFPFFKATGAAGNIDLTGFNSIRFFKSDGSASNIALG